MISMEEWNARIDAFIAEENRKIGEKMPVQRIFCQDDTDRSGGGLYNETVTVDTIGRFARALGDTNPLYSAPAYAEQTIWKGIVAPPLLECCICSTFLGGRLPRLRGIQVFDAGTRWERFLPIRPGDTFAAVTTFLGVEEKTKAENGEKDREKGGGKGRLLLRSHSIDLFNQRAEHVSRLTARSIIKCAAPEPAQEPAQEPLQKPVQELSQRSVQKPSQRSLQEQAKSSLPGASRNSSQGLAQSHQEKPVTARPRYTQDQLDPVYENLDAQLRGDFRRGAALRSWEEIAAGEELPQQIVGPYDESDGQSLMAAIGAANAFATKWGTIRSRRGKGVTDPETGAARHPVDRHISDAAARAQGLPRAIVSGIHTQALLAKAVSDWMGDAGSLRTLDCRCRRPLYYGDLSIQRGRVLRRYSDGGNRYALLFMEAVNQDGVVHTDALAHVILPS